MKAFQTALGAAMLVLCGAAWGQAPFDDRPKITVNGEAVVNVVPDKIVINLGIESWDPDITAAKQKNSSILKRTLDALRDLGVPEGDMQTDHLSIEPRWETESHRERFIGHFVRNSLSVTLSDPAKVEELVTRALEAGVNYIHGIDFETTEFKEHREKAREMALLAAREKAEKMAAVLGQKVGAPLQINEGYGGGYGGFWSSWYGWGYRGGGQGMSQNVMQNAPSVPEDTGDTVALGKIAIRANVSVTFELER